MKALVVLVLAMLAACPRTLSQTDRDALQDFRTVEQACLARAAEILRDESIHLSDSTELARAVRDELVAPWQQMRMRLALADRKLGDELSSLLRRYLDEREVAWQSLAKAIDIEGTGMQPTVNHRWQYRESNDAADTDKKILDAKLAALKLPPLPPLEPPPVVDLDPPPLVTTPGAAYFLAGRSVVRLDDRGFQTIATDVDAMDVLPDGTMWACSYWHVAYWDGTKTTDYKPKISSRTCTAGPGGELWVLVDRRLDRMREQLGRFDGTTWKIVETAVGDPDAPTEALIADRDGRLYAVNRSSSSDDSDQVLAFDRTWKPIEISHAGRVSVNRLFRAADGAVWASYEVSNEGHRSKTSFARLSPSGGDDAAAFIVLDPQRNVLEQGTKQRKLPMPVAIRWHDRDTMGPFAMDGSGRLWIDLVDGINVIDKGGKRTVYPRGSIDGIRENVRKIVVTGAGPTLVPPGPVATRTIKGQLRDAGKVELAMCGDVWGYECLPGLPMWKTFSDAEGYFTFEHVPRWKLRISGLTGLSGQKVWRAVNAECCQDKDEIEAASFDRDIY